MRRLTAAPAALAVLSLAAAAQGQEMVRVPAGAFTMGSARGDPDEAPPHRVELAAFAIDRREVTQARYQRCVAAGGCRRAKVYPGSVGPDLPAVGVSWCDAISYCTWVGKRLPTEAEWERAARGLDGRTYPWGSGLDCTRANFGSYLGDGPCGEQNPGRILPGGSRPRGISPTGAHDMAGNVWEWVADAYRPYPRGKARAPREKASERSPIGVAPSSVPPDAVARALDPDATVLRVVRGGSCCSYFAMPTTTNRLAFPADYADGDLGFRCVR